MLKIGDFSKMSKVTIKALRYYEKEGLLKPKYIDEINNYRYYESNQLLEVSRIISLKQAGLSIDEIKKVILNHINIDLILLNKRDELEQTISKHNSQLTKINYLLKETSYEKSTI